MAVETTRGRGVHETLAWVSAPTMGSERFRRSLRPVDVVTFIQTANNFGRVCTPMQMAQHLYGSRGPAAVAAARRLVRGLREHVGVELVTLTLRGQTGYWLCYVPTVESES